MFHVLAHVGTTRGLRASVFDSVYVAFVQRHAGPASARPLGMDAEVLGRCLPDDVTLIAVQALAWLFASVEDAARTAVQDMSTLAPVVVEDGTLLSSLVAHGPVVEVLRIACELERPVHAALPRVSIDDDALARALERVEPAAPGLADCEIALVRSLRLRGRVRGREIWVGAPDPDLGVSVSHAAWQAAHEASVRELSLFVDASSPATVEEIEHAALVLLATRAADTGLAEPHANWLAALHPDAGRLAGVEPTGVGDQLVKRARAPRR